MTKTIVYTSSGTFTVPSDWQNTGAYIEVLDAGGLATRDGDTGFIYGGAGGEYRKYGSLSFTAGQTKTVTVGDPSSITSSMTGASSLVTSNSGGAGGTDGDLPAIRGFGGGAAGSAGGGGSGAFGVGGSAGSGSWTANATATGSAATGTYSPGAGGSSGYGAGANGSYDSEGAGLTSSGQQLGLVIITYDPVVGGVTLTTTTSLVVVDNVALASGVVWLDGFDSYNAAADLAIEYAMVGSYTVNTTGGRFGGGALQMANNGGAARKQFLPFKQAWQGFAHKRDRVGGGDDRIAQWCSGTNGTIELTLTLNNVTGVLKVWRGNLSTLLATAAIRVVNPLIYHWYEWYVSFDGSAGVTEVRCDGVQMLSATGLNTKQTSATDLSAAQLGSPGVDAVWVYYDDWYVTFGPRIGDMRIVTRVPTSDASPNVGTPSTGTAHWSLVDESPINTTDYVTLLNVNGNSEMFGLSTFPAAAVTVYGVRVSASGLKSDGIRAYNVKVQCKSSSTTAEGEALGFPGGSQYGSVSGLFLKDPATGAAWTTSGAAAMTAGVKVAVV